jgi:leucyl aminopeptidase
VLFLPENYGNLQGFSKILPEKLLQNLESNIKADKRFKATVGSYHQSYINLANSPASEASANSILCLVFGAGKHDKFDHITQTDLGGCIAAKLNELRRDFATIILPQALDTELLANLTLGIKLRNYSFNQHYHKKKEEHLLHLKKIEFCADYSENSPEKAAIEKAVEKSVIIGNAVHFTRDLVSETPNNLYPVSFAQNCRELSKFGLKVKILGQEEMRKLGMNALLGVAQGSAQEPQLVVLEWHGKPEQSAMTMAMVGKGVTFDSGGINIKTGSSISDMKYDMAGAGAVAGAMRAMAELKVPHNVVGVLGLVENMPSGTAQRPSDVVKSMSGITIEVDNTDAEGRLVLADAIHYTIQEYQPPYLVDMATLTGAITVALGDIYAGLFSNDDEFAQIIEKCGKKSQEWAWRLPMGDVYDKQIDSVIADVRNTSSQNRGAGSITAAQFIQRFVKEASGDKCKWAHLDIAGLAWTKVGTHIIPKGATGYGVRLMLELVSNMGK